MSSTALAWAEYEAVKAVEKMSAVDVLMYVDKRVIDCQEHTMAEYRKMAVVLIMEEA